MIRQIYLRYILGFTIEKACITFSLSWGAWLAFMQPLKYIPGLRYLVKFTSFTNIDANYVWGALVLTLGVIRLTLLCRDADLKLRGWFALLGAGVYTLITMLIALDSYSSTGIPCYGIIALMNIILYIQFTEARVLVGNSMHPQNVFLRD